jgi:hypothetical protein
MTVSAKGRRLALAAVFAAGFAGLASAKDVTIPDGELPPPAQAEPQKPKPCVSHEPGFRTVKGRHIFKVALTNSCERRQRCNVNVYLVTSRGPQQHRATLTLARAWRGKSAQKDYVIRTPENGGSAQVSQSCKAV